MKELTPRQRKLLGEVARASCVRGAPHSLPNCKVRSRCRASRAYRICSRRFSARFITVVGGVRGRQHIIELSARGKALTGVGAPVVGTITAGPLREAAQESEEVVTDFAATLGFRTGDFFLRVEGDSMIGDGIMSGDLVLLRPDVEARQGEIAAVQLVEDGSPWQTTLKHIFLHLDEGYVELRASNPVYEPMVVACDQTKVAGVYRGLLRSAATTLNSSFEL